MSAPKDHHFFAQFHLEAWAEKPDGKIPTYKMQDGAIRFSRRHPKGTGFEPHLYSLEDVLPEERGRIEIEFFGKYIDNNAAPVYQKIIADEQLTQDERA